MMNAYLCPVCGYGMEDPPSDFNICPSCGTEFGYHDANVSTNTLRAAWLRNGGKWWSATDPKPDGWDPYAQVSDLLSQPYVWQSLTISAGNVARGDLARMAVADSDQRIAEMGLPGRGQGQTQQSPQSALR